MFPQQQIFPYIFELNSTLLVGMWQNLNYDYATWNADNYLSIGEGSS